MGREEESRRIIVICLLAALLVAGAAFFLYHGFSEEKEEPLPVTDLSQKETSQRTLLVYVTGAVRQPGVYELPQGSHFFDAVKEAGDVLPYAAMEDVNMAEPLEDGMKIHVPLDPEQRDARASGLISINSASAKELEALPGVGAVTAEKIVRYREEHGAFLSKEDLKKVPSIGESRYQKMADQITL